MGCVLWTSTCSFILKSLCMWGTTTMSSRGNPHGYFDHIFRKKDGAVHCEDHLINSLSIFCWQWSCFGWWILGHVWTQCPHPWNKRTLKVSMDLCMPTLGDALGKVWMASSYVWKHPCDNMLTKIAPRLHKDPIVSMSTWWLWNLQQGEKKCSYPWFVGYDWVLVLLHIVHCVRTYS